MIGPAINGRDAQSMRFFVAAENEWLYSGPAMMTPPASAIAARNARSTRVLKEPLRRDPENAISVVIADERYALPPWYPT